MGPSHSDPRCPQQQCWVHSESSSWADWDPHEPLGWNWPWRASPVLFGPEGGQSHQTFTVTQVPPAAHSSMGLGPTRRCLGLSGKPHGI